MQNNKLLIGDTYYEITKAYRNGATARRNNIPCTQNPYSISSQYRSDWDDGHTNESADLHIIDGVDSILAKRENTSFSVKNYH